MDKRQKILIVDDAEFNRVILKEILGETYNPDSGRKSGD